MLGKLDNVFGPVTKRRQGDYIEGQAIQQIRPELALFSQSR